MDTSSGAIAAILLMAIATYATRAGGLWIASRFQLSDRAGAFLEYIPGAIVISLVAPIVVTGGPVFWIAGAAVALAAWRSGSLIISLFVGVGVVFVLRSLGLG